MPFLFVGCLHCRLEIAKVVETVENTDNVDSVGNGFLYEIFYHIVAVGTVSQNILPAEEHLQLCVLKASTELAEPVPRILLQET